MKKLTLAIIIAFTILVAHSCEHTPQKTEPPIIPTPNFVLSENERKLLCLDSCNKEINLDSLYTITNFNKVRSQFQLPEKEQKGNLCFNLVLKLNKDSIETNFKIQFIQPNSYKEIGQIIDQKHITVLEYKDTSCVFLSDQATNKSTLISDLTKYTTGLYLEKFGSSNMHKYYINLYFRHNESTYYYSYLSELITGYIIAQRILSKKYFKKDINELTTSEITKLRNNNPLLFKLSLIIKPLTL
jgi:hypothetical protein